MPAAAMPDHTVPSRLAADNSRVPTWKFWTSRICKTSTKTVDKQAKLKLMGLKCKNIS
jgi:hypothetical protein